MLKVDRSFCEHLLKALKDGGDTTGDATRPAPT
jgi:hypothetical protein